MQVVIVRNGQTQGIEERRFIGAFDEPLSEKGKATARAAVPCPSISTVYSSPKLRAAETARICFPQARLQFVRDFEEMNFGSFENRTPSELADDGAYLAWVETERQGKCPNGESRLSFTTRVTRAFARLVGEALEQGDDTLAIVAHDGTIMAIMSTFAEDARSFLDWHVENCRGYCATVRLAGFVGTPELTNVTKINDLRFLSGS